MDTRSLIRLPRLFKGCLQHNSERSVLCRNLSLSSRKPAEQHSRSLGSVLAGSNWGTNRQSPSQASSSQAADNLQNYYDVEKARPKEHHLHIFATKHNCHLTLSAPTELSAKGPRRKTLISLSSGNIGFRKAARGSYDAAFQLGSYMMSRIQNQGLLADISRLELVFRGFGPGREALTKILLGIEGTQLRGRVVRVVDTTRIKFGGTRSRNPRRLG